jgi:predicted DNA-binding transcriptional regulator AlpA
MPATGPLLRPQEAAAYLGYSAGQYYALAAKGLLPRPIKIGPGHNGAAAVPRPWLDALISARANGSAAA